MAVGYTVVLVTMRWATCSEHLLGPGTLTAWTLQKCHSICNSGTRLLRTHSRELKEKEAACSETLVGTWFIKIKLEATREAKNRGTCSTLEHTWETAHPATRKALTMSMMQPHNLWDYINLKKGKEREAAGARHL